MNRLTKIILAFIGAICIGMSFSSCKVACEQRIQDERDYVNEDGVRKDKLAVWILKTFYNDNEYGYGMNYDSDETMWQQNPVATICWVIPCIMLFAIVAEIFVGGMNIPTIVIFFLYIVLFIG